MMAFASLLMGVAASLWLGRRSINLRDDDSCSRLLGSILGQKISSWRWALVWAAGPAVGVGVLARFLPEWAELGLGIPAILGIYGLVIWRRGFGPEDRVLFRKHKN